MAVGASMWSKCLLLLAGFVVSTPCLADETATAKERAMDLYEQSLALYQQGDLEQAGELLSQAYALDPNPTLLYNQARVHEGLGDLEAAIDAYRRFLVAAPSAPDRGAIQKRISTLEAQLADRRQLREAEQAEEQSAERPDPVAPSPRETGVTPWLVLGAGGLALGSGAILGLVSRREGERARDDETFLGAQAAERRANDYAVAANVAFAVGGAASLAGVTWVLVRKRRQRVAAAALFVDASGARISGRF